MSAKITITGEDKTAGVFSSLKNRLKDTGAAADKMGKSIAGSTKGISQFLGFNMLKETGTKLFGIIDSLADHGNEGMGKLRDSVRSVQSAFMDAASDPQFQEFLKGIGDSIEKNIVPAITKLPSLWRSVQDSIAGGITTFGEKLGVFAEGSREELEKMQEAQRKVNEENRKAQEILNARLRQERLLSEFTKATASDSRGKYIQLVKDEETLNDIRDTEIERIKALIATEKDDEKIKKEITELQKLNSQVEMRQAQIRQENAARDREDNQKRIEGIKAVRHMEALLVHDENEWAAELKKRNEEASQKRWDAEQKKLEAYRNQVKQIAAMLNGGGQAAASAPGAGANLAAGILDDPRLQRRAASNARRRASARADEQVNLKLQDQFGPERKRIQDQLKNAENAFRPGRAGANPEADEVSIRTARDFAKQKLADLAKQEEAARRKLSPAARRKAIRGITPGQVNAQALNLADEQIDQMTNRGVRRGTIKGEDVQLAKDALRTNQSQLNENQKQTQLLENIKQLLTPKNTSGPKQPPINRRGAQQRGRGNGFG